MYSTFLMIELARVKGIIPKELEYDLTWDMGRKLYNEFVSSDFDDSHEPEYECIIAFLNEKLKEKENPSEPKQVKYNVIVKRISSATRDIEVMAVSKEEAKKKAMEEAGNEVFDSEDTADYEVDSVSEIAKNKFGSIKIITIFVLITQATNET